jgi:hypothetical protein
LQRQLARHITTKLTKMTQLPDLWSKAKISITFLQIMASLNVAYSVPWPPHFQRILQKLNILNLNILNLPGLSYTCIDRSIDFFDEFLVALLFPIFLTVFFLALYYTGVKIIERKVDAHSPVVRALEAQAAELKRQLIKKMRSISFCMKRRDSRGPPPSRPSAAGTPAHSYPPSLQAMPNSGSGSSTSDPVFSSPPPATASSSLTSPPRLVVAASGSSTSPLLSERGASSAALLQGSQGSSSDMSAQQVPIRPLESPAVRSAVIDIFSPIPRDASGGLGLVEEEPSSTRSTSSSRGKGRKARKARKKAAFSNEPPTDASLKGDSGRPSLVSSEGNHPGESGSDRRLLRAASSGAISSSAALEGQQMVLDVIDNDESIIGLKQKVGHRSSQVGGRVT